jgi:hypothetical protein
MFVHHVSTPESRIAARERAVRPSRVDRMERVTRALASDAHAGAVRLSKSRVASLVAGVSLFVLGSVHDFQLPF